MRGTRMSTRGIHRDVQADRSLTNASESTYSSEREACHKHPNAKRKHARREWFLNKYGPNYRKTKHNHNMYSHYSDAHNN